MYLGSSRKMLLLLIIYSLSLCNAHPSREDWEEFKAQYNKHYNSSEEEKLRRDYFIENMNIIEKHNVEFNNGFVSFEMGINQYGDLSQQEFEKILLGVGYDEEVNDNDEEEVELRDDYVTSESWPSFFTSFRNKGIEMKKSQAELWSFTKVLYKIYEKMVEELEKLYDTSNTWGPLKESVDWVKMGAVTPAKDQGFCGSCWAFSALGALESHLFLKTGILASLSVQQMVDCTYGNGTRDNHGCLGGNMDVTYQYIMNNNGVALDRDYPYEYKKSDCRYENRMAAGTCISYVGLEGEESLQYVLSERGPIAVIMDATSIQFRFYRRGVYESHSCSGQGTNHAVVLVGFGEMSGTGYWQIKNSWGTAWGENGIAHVSRLCSCGINNYGIYPIV